MLHRSLSRMVGFRTLAPNAFSTFGWVYITALMVCYGQTNMVTESAIPGVTLIGPTDSRFDTSVSHLVSGNTVALAAIQPALPFSVVIMNSGSHTFRYYVVRFAFVTATGKRLASVSSVDLRDNDLRIRPNKVVPGSFRLVSIVPQFSRAVASGRAPQLATMRFYPDLLRSLHVYDAANNVVASVDCVVFDNGQLVGPDISGTMTRINTEVLAQRELLDQVRHMGDLPDSDLINTLDLILAETEQPGSKPLQWDFRTRQRKRLARAWKTILLHGGRTALNTNLANRVPFERVWR